MHQDLLLNKILPLNLPKGLIFKNRGCIYLYLYLILIIIKGLLLLTTVISSVFCPSTSILLLFSPYLFKVVLNCFVFAHCAPAGKPSSRNFCTWAVHRMGWASSVFFSADKEQEKIICTQENPTSLFHCKFYQFLYARELTQSSRERQRCQEEGA